MGASQIIPRWASSFVQLKRSFKPRYRLRSLSVADQNLSHFVEGLRHLRPLPRDVSELCNCLVRSAESSERHRQSISIVELRIGDFLLRQVELVTVCDFTNCCENFVERLESFLRILFQTPLSNWEEWKFRRTDPAVVVGASPQHT